MKSVLLYGAANLHVHDEILSMPGMQRKLIRVKSKVVWNGFVLVLGRWEQCVVENLISAGHGKMYDMG